MELDRHERLRVLGEEIAKFEIPYEMVDKTNKFKKQV